MHDVRNPEQNSRIRRERGARGAGSADGGAHDRERGPDRSGLEIAQPLTVLLDADLSARIALREDRPRIWDRLAVRAPGAAPASPEEEPEEQEEQQDPEERDQRPEPEPAVIVGREHCQHDYNLLR